MPPTKQVTIFAATGGIGHQLVEQALAAGHDVTAVVRDPKKLSTRAVRAVVADLTDPDQAVLESAVECSPASVRARKPRTESLSRSTRAIVRAMQAAASRRIVVVSAALVGSVPSPGRPHPPKHDPGDGFFMRHLLSPMATAMQRKHMVDLAVMEDIVRDSGLDWTVIRPPQLSDKPLTAAYRTTHGQNLRRGLHVSRADVAHLMMRTIERPESIGQAIGVAD